jgi:hypothetical protein
MSAIVAIFLVVMLFRVCIRHFTRRVAVQPAVQVIVVQPGQIPQPPAAPPAPVQTQYSKPFEPGFLGLNRQN